MTPPPEDPNGNRNAPENANGAGNGNANDHDGPQVQLFAPAGRVAEGELELRWTPIEGAICYVVFDRSTSAVALVTRRADGNAAVRLSFFPARSSGGRRIAIDSTSNGLVSQDQNKLRDVFNFDCLP